MENNKNLKELLQDGLDQKGLSLLRLQQLTEIPERFLESLVKGDFHKMPAAPYVRGYLIKIATMLNLNSEDLWKQYKKEVGVKSSGANDRLPENRFIIRSINKQWLVMGAIIIALVIYLAVNLGNLLGIPTIEITIPASEISATTFPIVTLSGKINPSDTLKINGQEILTDATGKFEKTYNLQPGLNIFEFSVKRFLGKEIQVVKQVIFQSQ